MTTIANGTEYLDDQERAVYRTVQQLAADGRAANTSQVASRSGYSRTTISGILYYLYGRGFLRDEGKGNAHRWRPTDKPVFYWRDRDSLVDFLRRFAPDGGSRTVIEVDPRRNEEGDSPFIILRHGPWVMIINPLTFDDHLCVDMFPFEASKAATASLWGIRDGRDVTLPATGTTSHGKPSLDGPVSVMLGRQG